MARMYPTPLPRSVCREKRRAAEVSVYEALRDQLDDRVTVYYGVSWVTRWRDGDAGDGETDFVVAHPDHGLLVLEVKGGRVGRDGATGDWFSEDGAGGMWAIKDPFHQARTAKFALKKKLSEHPALAGRGLDMGHGVVLPDSADPGHPLVPDAPREIVAFAGHMAALGARVLQMFAYWHPQLASPLRPDRRSLDAITEVLATSFELRQPLGVALAGQEREFIRLTDEQVTVLDLVKRNRRVAVSGGAGTGKTVLALHKARGLAEEGFNVLLTCFNRPLADHMRRSVGEVERLRIWSFHQLCWHLATEAGVPLEDPNRRDLPVSYFTDTMPAALGRALDTLPQRFDAIVVDEAQDLLDGWWEPLLRCLTDRARGVLYLFYDDNQNVYERTPSFPRGLADVHLSRNLRNTQRIHAAAMRFYHGEPMEAVGPEGRQVEFVAVPGPEGVEAAVGAVLARLLREGVKPGDLAVLTGAQGSALRRDGAIGTCPVTRSPEAPDTVLVESIRRFKGLERQVVVLADLEGIDDEDADALLYVGVSRARGHLVVVATPATLSRFS